LLNRWGSLPAIHFFAESRKEKDGRNRAVQPARACGKGELKYLMFGSDPGGGLPEGVKENLDRFGGSSSGSALMVNEKTLLLLVSR